MSRQETSLGEGFLVAIAASSVSAVALSWINSRMSRQHFSLPQFVDPSSVRSLAAEMPPREDDFILQAWQTVGSGIKYQAFASNIVFKDHTVLCQRCLLNRETLRKGRGNCVSKSALLVSILRNRLPANSVYMALGTLAKNGTGGHAWVVVQRQDGMWYLLEATISPPPNPWVALPTTSTVYIPEVLVNDQDLICYSSQTCITVKAHPCPCQLTPA